MRKKLNKMFALLLCIILVEGFFPASVFAGHDDGQDCPYCGHYHWDDYMCPDCGGCSAECTNSDCYEENHCPECGVCRAEFGDDYFCPDCGLCYACATDDRPDHCVNCGLEGTICPGCNVCDDCIIDKLEPGHVHEYNIINNDDVYHWTECSCGKMFGKTNPEQHTYGAWTETKAPTETEYGTEARSCTFCGHEQARKKDKLAHNHMTYTQEEFLSFLASSAGTWKYYDKDGTLCSYDPDVTVRGEYVVDGKAVFGVTGAAHWFACKGCDKYKNHELHQYGQWTYITDDSFGNMIYSSECLICSHRIHRKVAKGSYPVIVTNGKAFSGDTETLSGSIGQTLKIKPSEPIGTLVGKKFDHWEVIKGGITLKDRFSSETTFTVVEIPKTADNLWSDYLIEIEAIFTDCDHNGTGRIHSGAISPTCTANGKEDDTFCERCMQVLAEGAVIPATGHGEPVFDPSSVKVVYCNQKGAGYSGNKVCPDCGEILEKGEPTKKIHICESDPSQLETRNAKAPTCSDTGYTGDKYCKGCNTRMEKCKKIDKLTHTFGEWTVVVKPTTDRQGKKTRVCSKCGAKENAPIPRLGTKYSVTVTPSEHGIVVASKLTEIADGEEITLTVLPDTGYKLKTLTVTDSNGNKITLTDGKFIMPESNVTVGAEFIKSDIPISDVTYTAIGGGGIVWTKGSSDAPTLTVKRSKDDETCFSHFTSVEIDGITMTPDTDYTAKAGSTIITLKPSALQSLDVGMHIVTVNFDDGKMTAPLTINAAGTPGGGNNNPGSNNTPGADNKPGGTANTVSHTGTPASKSPATGDDHMLVLWIMLMSISIIGAISLTTAQKRNRLDDFE